MDIKKEVRPFIGGIIQSIGLVILGWVIFWVFKQAGYREAGALVFILIVTVGFLIISIRNVRNKHESLGVFLSDMCIIIAITILAFAAAYSSPNLSDKDYFRENEVPKELTFSEATYFSVVTLSTLGYGDIAPRGVFRIFAATEALLGFLYMGILVSGLTLYMTKKTHRKRKSKT